MDKVDENHEQQLKIFDKNHQAQVKSQDKNHQQQLKMFGYLAENIEKLMKHNKLEMKHSDQLLKKE